MARREKATFLFPDRVALGDRYPAKVTGLTPGAFVVIAARYQTTWSTAGYADDAGQFIAHFDASMKGDIYHVCKEMGKSERFRTKAEAVLTVL